MKCKHENTRKMFWLDQDEGKSGKWQKTDYGFCLDCGMVVMHSIKAPEVAETIGIKQKQADKNITKICKNLNNVCPECKTKLIKKECHSCGMNVR